MVSRLHHQADDDLCRAERRARRAVDHGYAARRVVARGAHAALENGLPARHVVTLDNALKMLMVKSPNDVAVMVAEGVSRFGRGVRRRDERGRRRARAAGNRISSTRMACTIPTMYSSARDMAILGRALLKEFPEHADLFGIGALQLGDQIIRNHNGLIGRYPGADGMKTGFTCPAGLNVVASATRNGRQAHRRRFRLALAARAHQRGGDAARPRLRDEPTGEKLDALAASPVTAPPDMRSEICRGRGRAAIAGDGGGVSSPPRWRDGQPRSAGGRELHARCWPPRCDTPPALCGAAPSEGISTRCRYSSARSRAGPARSRPPPGDADESRRRPRSAPMPGDKACQARRGRLTAPSPCKSAVKPPAKLSAPTSRRGRRGRKGGRGAPSARTRTSARHHVNRRRPLTRA